MARKEIEECLESGMEYMLTGDVNEIIAYLTDKKAAYEETYHKLEVSDRDSGWDSFDLSLFGTRYETSAERKKRLAKQKKDKQKKLADKKAKLDRLQRECAKLEQQLIDP